MSQYLKSKYFKLEEFKATADNLKNKNLTIVQCHGVFDLLHPGHIRHLQSAKKLGDILVVSITADRFVGKGPGRPAFTEQLRAETLSCLECVDYVVLSEHPSAVPAIQTIRPNVYSKGNEYAQKEADITGKIVAEENAVQAVGGRLHFTDDITFSSSSLINSYMSIFTLETEEWLKGFRKKYTADDITNAVNKVSSIRVLVIGEAIIDEYDFCDGLGKSSKDPILAIHHRSIEAYAGGSLAVANHAAGFTEKVGLLTFLGEKNSREDFIRKSLLPNVTAHFVKRKNSPTITKRRFVDRHTNARIIEVYDMNDEAMVASDEAEIIEKMDKLLPEYDVVIVTDYGHGFFSPAVIETLCKSKCFLAVNTQTNAGNRGFNTISKYPRADYVCLAGHEISLETRMKHAPWIDLVFDVIQRVQCPRFTVTHGKDGTFHYSKDSGITEVPALAGKVTDRVGAGDAVLAITALLAYQGVAWDLVGFLGNLAGAEMVADLGNRRTINKISLLKHATALMK